MSCSTASSGFSSSAETRGSLDRCGIVSLATSSDSTIIRDASSTGSTMYSIAATARCVSDTSRRERTLTRLPAGEVQSAVRVKVPLRMSNVRTWLCRVP